MMGWRPECTLETNKLVKLVNQDLIVRLEAKGSIYILKTVIS